MKSGLPNIAKVAQHARAAIEEMWTRMARKHRYGVGLDMRVAANGVLLAIRRCWREKDLESKVVRARELIEAVDALYFCLQLGKDVNAFGRWPEFQAVAKLVGDVGQQSNRWLSSLLNKGQNAGATPSPPEQRAQTLSSRSAPLAGATP